MLRTFQKHLPKLHLTHKSLKLDFGGKYLYILLKSPQKQKSQKKQKVGCRIGDLTQAA